MAQNLNLQNIKAIAYDLDGVATDGSIIPIGPTPEGLLRVRQAHGPRRGIISGAETEPLRSRCIHMGVKEENLFLGVRGKLAVFRKFCEQNGLDASEVAFFGDDIPDTQVLRACGLGIAPADAVDEAKAAADYVTVRPGGRGCIREGIEMIMKAQGKWVFDEDHFDQIF